MGKNQPLELIDLKGTPREIGRQYGEACAGKVKKMIDYWGDLARLLHPEADNRKLATLALKLLKPTEEFAPDLVDEIRGIAEGAGVPFEEVFMIHAGVELKLCFDALDGCTSFGATGEATRGGITITGQNLDWKLGAELIMQRVQPTDGPKYLCLSYVGSLGQQGINEAGLAQQTNLLDCGIVRIGVPRFPLMHQKVLKQRTLADALGTIYRAQRGSSGNFLLASAQGDIIDVESRPDDLGIVYPERDFLVHSNNFLTERFKSTDKIYGTAPDSFLRVHRMKRLIERNYGNLAPGLMKELLADHNGYPDAICRHGDESDPPAERLCSLASMVCSPAEGKMWVTNGNPCENEFVEYSL